MQCESVALHQHRHTGKRRKMCFIKFLILFTIGLEKKRINVHDV